MTPHITICQGYYGRTDCTHNKESESEEQLKTEWQLSFVSESDKFEEGKDQNHNEKIAPWYDSENHQA